MSLRWPQSRQRPHGFDAGENALNGEIASEKASTLGRAGRFMEAALLRLEDATLIEHLGREALLREAADAVWQFLIQRDVVGLRDQAVVVREYQIPRAVMVRIGVR
ncbi:MAG: hypothetical protein CGW95_11340 [Phenylobacterium zucineum]|nr:MAG: hypothetical protein CGW95_11340 [Phenylobacterium zucineum]